MANEQVKNFIKSVRRFQKNFKWSLAMILVILLAVAGAVIYYRHALRNAPLPTPEHDVQLPSDVPVATATPSAMVAPQGGSQGTMRGGQAGQAGQGIAQRGGQNGGMNSNIAAKNNRIYYTRNPKTGKYTVKHVVTVQPRVAPAHVTRTAQASTYVVLKGDSLWKISAAKYHSGQHWPRIYSANRQVIGTNPNLIYPHTRLLIPRISRTRLVSRMHRAW